MDVLVTGATGFVGRHLVPALVRRHAVTCLVRDASGANLPPEVDLIVADLTDPAFARRLPGRTDAVVHLAQAYLGFPDAADELFGVNAASTVALAEYARRAGVTRFVFTSSGSVYRPAKVPLTEDAETTPVSFHPATKLMSEIALRHYAGLFGVATLRLFCPYGPGQVNRMVPRLVEAVASGSTVTLSRGGEPSINPIYITDLVRVMEAALDDERSYTVNVAGPEPLSIRDLAEIIGRHVGRAPRFEDRDTDVEGDLIAETSLMRQIFGAHPLIAPAEGLGRMIGAQMTRAS
jgi:nucleoside-diphosphate-sugar epimerase